MINTFFIYLVQSAFSIAILWIAYKAFLANQSYFNINRIILLLIVGFGFFGPLVAAAFYAGIDWANVQVPGGQIAGNAISNTLNEFIVRPEGNDNKMISIFGILLLIYITGVAIQLIRLAYNFYQLMRLNLKSEKMKAGRYTFVLLPEGSASFSFFNWLFLAKGLMGNDSEGNQIIVHEKIHSKQKHSIDILLLELLMVWQWFNPFVYLLKKSVVENHEYLADRGTLEAMQDSSEYKLLLLQNILHQGNYALTNNFSYSLIKKRLKMMEKESSKLKLALTSLAFTFVFALVTISCSKTIDTNNENVKSTRESNEKVVVKTGRKLNNESADKVFTLAEVMPEYPGGVNELFRFLGENINYPEQAKTNKIEGKVYVSFTVKADGNVTDVHILRGIGGGCDEEAMRVVKLMSKWNPGKQDGKPVAVQYNLPINFKLK